MQPISVHCCEVLYFGCFGFRGELAFLNCDDVCMCVVNKQFEFLEFVFDSVYVDLKYDEISLIFTAGSVSFRCVCSYVVVVIPYVDVVVDVTDACTVVSVACVYAESVCGYEGDANARVVVDDVWLW